MQPNNLDAFVHRLPPELWLLTRELRGPKLLDVGGEHGGSVLSIAYNATGTWIASGGEDRIVLIWDAHTGAYVMDIHGHLTGVTSLDFHPVHPRVLVDGSYGKPISIWNLAPEGETFVDLEAKLEPAIGTVMFSPHGDRIFTDYDSEMVDFVCDNLLVWDTETGKLIHRRKIPAQISCEMSTDKENCLATGIGEDLWLWDARSMDHVSTLNGPVLRHRDGTRVACCEPNHMSLAFHPSGHYLASATMYHVCMWDIRVGKVMCDFGSEPRCLRFDSTGKQLATGTHEGTLQLWNVTNCAEPVLRRQWETSSHVVMDLAYDGTGTGRLAAGTFHGDVCVWDTN